MLVSRIERDKNNLNEYFDFVLKYGREPSSSTNVIFERRLYRWMRYMRETGKTLEIKNKGLLPNIFDKPSTRDQQQWFEADRLVTRVLKEGKRPSSKSKDPIEKELGVWLNSKRTKYRKCTKFDNLAILLRSLGVL